MRWVRWCIVIFLGIAGPAEGQSAAAGLYVEGNQLYRAGDFSSARLRYEAAVRTGIRDPRLLYNLANAMGTNPDQHICYYILKRENETENTVTE